METPALSALSTQTREPVTKSASIFISYHSQEPDCTLAQQFYEALEAAGHDAFMAGKSIRLGEGWAHRIDQELKQCVALTPVSHQ